MQTTDLSAISTEELRAEMRRRRAHETAESDMRHVLAMMQEAADTLGHAEKTYLASCETLGMKPDPALLCKLQGAIVHMPRPKVWPKPPDETL